MRLLEQLRQPTSRWLVWPALALALVASFFAGRFTAPERVEERVEYRTEVRTVKVEAKARQRASYTRTVKTPDGTVTTERSTTEALKVDTTTLAEQATAAVTVKRVELRPDWRVGVQAGATWREPALQLAGPLVLGVSVERRIAGGVSLGAWGSTAGAAGASISLEF